MSTQLRNTSAGGGPGSENAMTVLEPFRAAIGVVNVQLEVI